MLEKLIQHHNHNYLVIKWEYLPIMDWIVCHQTKIYLMSYDAVPQSVTLCENGYFIEAINLKWGLIEVEWVRNLIWLLSSWKDRGTERTGCENEGEIRVTPHKSKCQKMPPKTLDTRKEAWNWLSVTTLKGNQVLLTPRFQTSTVFPQK